MKMVSCLALPVNILQRPPHLEIRQHEAPGPFCLKAVKSSETDDQESKKPRLSGKV
jgi:hypothetical protein